MSTVYEFAALRFTEDENLRGRVYWYLTDFPVQENEEVLAPVGPHDRLQKARVERVHTATGQNAPYDVRLLKRIEARYGARGVRLGEILCREFGGVRYDDRHYTRFGVLLYADHQPSDRGLEEYGISSVFEAPESGDDTIYRTILLGHGIALIGGEGRIICKMLLGLLQGRKAEKDALRALGFAEGELAKIAARLG